MLRGLDVSHHNGRVNWRAVYAAGARFAILKATEGVDFVDSTFASNLREARAAGIYCGAYHYFLPTGDAVAQADHFLTTVQKSVGAATIKQAFHHLLVPFLDLEEAGKMGRAALQRSAMAFEKHVQAALGRGCVIYTYPSFIVERLSGGGLDEVLAGYPLWIASYPKSGQPTGKPNIPDLWTTWRFWQYTDQGAWPGVSSSGVDLDVFAGDVADMEKLVIQ